LNETVEFDASNSTDKSGIRFWAFDFGDGTNTTWTVTPTTAHNYTATGTYSVTVTVMNEEGLIGQDSSLVQVQIKTVPEISQLFILPFFTLVTGLTIALYRKKHFK
jgi:PKD repeat protein